MDEELKFLDIFSNNKSPKHRFKNPIRMRIPKRRKQLLEMDNQNMIKSSDIKKETHPHLYKPNKVDLVQPEIKVLLPKHIEKLQPHEFPTFESIQGTQFTEICGAVSLKKPNQKYKTNKRYRK